MSADFQIFAKPVGPRCNLHCSYCYYLDKKVLYPRVEPLRMQYDILEQYIIQHIEATEDETVFFSWHGGEPTLAGIDFFRQVAGLQKKHLPHGKSLRNGIQTNGILLNESWCRFLAEEKFLVGLSLDGPEGLQNQYRTEKTGNGTFDKVLNGFHCLKGNGITPEILCVVSAANAAYPLEVYNFFKGLGIRYMTFLPLVNRVTGTEYGVTPESVSPEAFGHFLIRIFDEWVENDIGITEVQIFEETIRTAFDKEHTLCIFKADCGRVPVIEHNGDFYSCDHYVDEEHRIGNILDHKVSWYLNSPQQKAFGEDKSRLLPRYCRECGVLPMCNGECPKNRFLKSPDGEPGLNYLCRGYKMFFEHCLPFVHTIRQLSMAAVR